MRILFLGVYYDLLKIILDEYNDEIRCLQEPIEIDDVIEFDFIISFGYRHIIDRDILKHFDRRAINLHISYLPWNRGADPNLWSFLENTPKGVSIHYLDKGIDTGDIIAQRHIEWFQGDTLQSTYNRLMDELVALFNETWPMIRAGKVYASPQEESGTYHMLADKKPYEYLLVDGWNTAIDKIIGKAKKGGE